MKRIVGMLICLLATPGALAQAPVPRVAVIPFNSINVAKSDAQVLTDLFETALVTTEAYSVIEQNQIADILSAQEYSVSDCTDETCAVEFGKLLSAEMIVLGSVSSIGGKYILTSKLIDVRTGRNLKADKEEAGSLGELTGSAELLAYKMAGLTTQLGTRTVVARVFGEIFVETTPTEADIYVNGALKGKSPNLFTRVPVGAVLVESRKDNLYGSAEVEVTGAMRKVSITLTAVQGNLFISSTDKQVDVYLDGVRLGPLGSGLFENVTVGQHVLELKSGSAYSRDEVAIQEGESTKVEVFPRPYGSLSYKLPEGATAEVVSPTYREVIRGTGTLGPLWVGDYVVRATGERYNEYSQEISIEKGVTAQFAPTLEYSDAFAAAQAAKAEIARLQVERDTLARRLRTLEGRAKLGRWPKYVAFSCSAVAYALGVFFAVRSDEAYDQYVLAGQSDWAEYKAGFQQMDRLMWLEIGLGTGLAGVGALLWSVEPKGATDSAEITEGRLRLAEIEARIGALGGGAE